MNTYIEFLEKAQTEFLGGLQKAQDINLATAERTFAFTNQLLETRKAYMVKLAELATKNSQN